MTSPVSHVSRSAYPHATPSRAPGSGRISVWWSVATHYTRASPAVPTTCVPPRSQSGLTRFFHLTLTNPHFMISSIPRLMSSRCVVPLLGPSFILGSYRHLLFTLVRQTGRQVSEWRQSTWESTLHPCDVSLSSHLQQPDGQKGDILNFPLPSDSSHRYLSGFFLFFCCHRLPYFKEAPPPITSSMTHFGTSDSHVPVMDHRSRSKR